MLFTNDPALTVLDTFRFDGSQIHFKELHALRTYEAFQQIQKVVAFTEILKSYNHLENELIKKSTPDKIVRLVFSSPDKYEISFLEFDPWDRAVSLEVVLETRCRSGLGMQNYKWAERNFWENLRLAKKSDAVDVISVNEKDFIVETSRFNLFAFDRNNRTVYTPPLSSGCINGVYRRYSMNNKQFALPNGNFAIEEKNIHYSELKDYQLFVANSVRGVLPAELV